MGQGGAVADGGRAARALGGAWTGNSTRQLQGGIQGPTQLGFSQQVLLDLSVDLERWADWDGGKLWVQLLQVNLNQEAYVSSGSLQGSNSLVIPEPCGAPAASSLSLWLYCYLCSRI